MYKDLIGYNILKKIRGIFLFDFIAIVEINAQVITMIWEYLYHARSKLPFKTFYLIDILNSKIIALQYFDISNIWEKFEYKYLKNKLMEKTFPHSLELPYVSQYIWFYSSIDTIVSNNWIA